MARRSGLLEILALGNRSGPQAEPRLVDEHCDRQAKRKALNAATRRRLHRQVPDWRLTSKSLTRRWSLRDFDQAFTLARRVARLAKSEEHHPDIHLESFKHLRVVLSTHEVDGLTRNDFILAAHIDRAARSFDRPKRRRRPPVDIVPIPFVP